MTAPPPRRPWWRRKRWRIALGVWLALPALYVLGSGPYGYCEGRGWCGNWPSRTIYQPFIRRIGDTAFGARWFAYNRACRDLGRKHAAQSAASD